MDIDTAKRIDILTVIGHWPLRKIASTGGGEYSGPCPWCGGYNRLHVQPNHPDGGRWFCRQCSGDNWHDTIDWVMKRDGVELPEALCRLDPNGYEQPVHIKLPSAPAPKKIDEADGIDRPVWTSRALKFIQECQDRLASPEGAPALSYLIGRGLTPDTLLEWHIGYNHMDGTDSARHWGLPPGETMHLPAGIVIPCMDGAILRYVKIRRDDGNPKYQQLRGSHNWMFNSQSFKDNLMGFLFESELDVLLAWQTGFGVGFASLPAYADKLKPEWLHDAIVEDIWVAYDSDQPGQEKADKLCSQSSHIHKTKLLPMGKDLTEYHQAGGDVLAWIADQLENT